MSDFKFIILGCGDSGGVPRIGNDWGKCDPNNPLNIRTRPSVIVTSPTTNLLIDTGPDLRNQINREGLSTISAVLYTHSHSDHIMGIDDLRHFHDKEKRRIPIYVDELTDREMRTRFTHIFVQQNPFYPIIVDTHIWRDTDYGREQMVGDIKFIPFQQDHGTIQTLGFRFGNIGYSTDMVDLDDKAIGILKGIDIWIADAGNFYMEKPSVHANKDRLLELRDKIGVKTVFMTHLKYNLDYETVSRDSPDGVEPAHDGLSFDIRY